MKQYCLPTNPSEENTCGQGGSCITCAWTPQSQKMEEKAGKSQNSPTPVLTVRQRCGKLFYELDLSGLDSWTLELVDAAHKLLAKYHDLFSLDPAELGCTHSTEHIIKVTDNTPFKEQFRLIPPPMVEEVRNHLKEMLESGTIRPSQSAWCNAVVLVWKKDRDLHFCINFCHLNAHTKRIPTLSLGYKKH